MWCLSIFAIMSITFIHGIAPDIYRIEPYVVSLTWHHWILYRYSNEATKGVQLNYLSILFCGTVTRWWSWQQDFNHSNFCHFSPILIRYLLFDFLCGNTPYTKNIHTVRTVSCFVLLWSWSVLSHSPSLLNEHYSDVIMSAIASQITSLTIVYSTVYSGADQRKHQWSPSLAFVRGIYRWPVNSPHIGPVTRAMFQFDDVIMSTQANLTVMYASQESQDSDDTCEIFNHRWHAPICLSLTKSVHFFYMKLFNGAQIDCREPFY